MNRRSFNKVAVGAAVLGDTAKLFGQAAQKTALHFEPDWQSIRRHQVPEWYQNGKLGIFIHWGLYSVPAWAPPTGELGKVDWNKWFTNKRVQGSISPQPVGMCKPFCAHQHRHQKRRECGRRFDL